MSPVCAPGGRNESAYTGGVLAAGIAGDLDAAGGIDTIRADFFDGLADVLRLQAAGQPHRPGDGISHGADEAGGPPNINEGAGATECARNRGIDQQSVSRERSDGRGGERLAQGKGFPNDARRGGLRAKSGSLLAVQLDNVKERPGPEEFLYRGVYHYGDFDHLAPQAGKPWDQSLQGDVALRAGVKIEAERIGAGVYRREGAFPVGNAADFYADGRIHSMTRPFACLMPSSRVMTRTLIRPFSERMKALRIQLTKEMIRAPRNAWPKEST